MTGDIGQSAESVLVVLVLRMTTRWPVVMECMAASCCTCIGSSGPCEASEKSP
jgi:hypothetical protein